LIARTIADVERTNLLIIAKGYDRIAENAHKRAAANNNIPMGSPEEHERDALGPFARTPIGDWNGMMPWPSHLAIPAIVAKWFNHTLVVVSPACTAQQSRASISQLTME
jgi:hypothetical protein